MTWFPMHSWHPVAIHVPLVGLTLAVALDLLAVRRGSRKWRDIATVLWWVGIVGAGLAVATGLLAYTRVEHSELAHEEMVLHRNLALVTTGVLTITAVWRWRVPLSRGAAALGVLAALALVAVGYLGGDLVYRHALGLPTERLEQISHERGGHEHSGLPHPGSHRSRNSQPQGNSTRTMASTMRRDSDNRLPDHTDEHC
jgi:uncharacterized membrane protein